MFFYLAFLLFHVRKFNIIIEKMFSYFLWNQSLGCSNFKFRPRFGEKHFFNQIFSGNWTSNIKMSKTSPKCFFDPLYLPLFPSHEIWKKCEVVHYLPGLTKIIWYICVEKGGIHLFKHLVASGHQSDLLQYSSNTFMFGI